MSICREFCAMVEELIEDLDDVFEGTCLAKGDNKDGKRTRTAPEPGDIIGVDRGIYQHYGIYAGDDCVIHYTAAKSDLDAKNATVQETSLERFLRDETEFFILENDDWSPADVEGAAQDESEEKEDPETSGEDITTCYGPSETVERARSRIGERKYNLLTNNCEHFVVWCKTGVSDSSQVRQWVAYCKKIIMGD